MRILLTLLLLLALPATAATWWTSQDDLPNQLKIYESPDITSFAPYSVAPEVRLEQLADLGDFIQIQVGDVSGYVLRANVVLFVSDQTFLEDVVYNNISFKTTSSEIYFKMFEVCYVMPLTAMRDVKTITTWTTVQQYLDDNGGIPPLTPTQEANCDF